MPSGSVGPGQCRRPSGRRPPGAGSAAWRPCWRRPACSWRRSIGWRVYDGRTTAARDAAIEQNADEFASQIAFQWSAGDLLSGDDLADQAAAGFDDLLSSAGLSPQSGPLADDARLAADTLLRRLPIDVELAESP